LQKLGHPFLYNAPASRLWSLQSWRGLTSVVLVVATAQNFELGSGRRYHAARLSHRGHDRPLPLVPGGAPPLLKKQKAESQMVYFWLSALHFTPPARALSARRRRFTLRAFLQRSAPPHIVEWHVVLS